MMREYSADMPEQADDLDNPWKEALDHFLEPFLALCFPVVHAGFDWPRGYESLDKELQQIAHDAKAGKRLADKLFKVWRKDGYGGVAARSHRSAGPAPAGISRAHVHL